MSNTPVNPEIVTDCLSAGEGSLWAVLLIARCGVISAHVFRVYFNNMMLDVVFSIHTVH